jgi:type I restriction enzyme M protein
LEREDKTKYAGLFAYLKSLRGVEGGDRRDIIANVFRGTLNRMINGYILREVLTVVNQINFASSEEMHTLSALYESMLKEMRDAAGDAGEFYTPRALVRFMVDALDPRLGETVLDPASGTGGFLVEAYEHLRKQCVSVEDFVTLQKQSVLGVEAKPLPYLLCQMNLLLHGLEYPQIAYENSLAVRLGDIGERERVDVILTNPPFGGEEESKILSNFPADKQTTETALLFVQLIMRKLGKGVRNGRAGVILPKGTPLSGDGVSLRIRQQLLDEFNLHTIIRLPVGTFAPYTNLETNILFFDTTGPTKEVWYFQIPLPEGRKTYTKTNPIKYEEFGDCKNWWNDRSKSQWSWSVDVEKLRQENYDFDQKNPSDPDAVAVSIHSISSSLGNIQDSIDTALLNLKKRTTSLVNQNDPKEYILDQVESRWNLVSIGDSGIQVNVETRNPAITKPEGEFLYIDLATVNKGIINNAKSILGINAPSRARRVIHKDDVIFSTVRPYLNGHAVIPPDLDDQICSTGFSVFTCSNNIIPEFLFYMLMSPFVIQQCKNMMRGGHYPALKDVNIRKILIPVPDRNKQMAVVDLIKSAKSDIDTQKHDLYKSIAKIENNLDNVIPSLLAKAFRGDFDY